MEADAVSNQRKRRVAAACDFCRRRKLGCDNRSPKCTKCINHNRECTYKERSGNERPSKSRIARLENENHTLRASLERLQTPATPSSAIIHTQTGGNQPPQSAAPPSPGPTPILTSTADSRFHGPSSALYEIETTPTVIGCARLTSRNHADEKSVLFAATSRQRQLELMNLKAGKLDFDGTDKDLGYDLLRAFWNRQHHSGNVVYRPAFMRDMACHGLHFSPLLLNAMLFLGSSHSPQLCGDTSEDTCVSGMTFRRKVENYLYQGGPGIFAKSNITTAQALLLMSDALFAWCDERSLSWHYLGLSINMIVDLGIHSLHSAFYRTQSVESQEIGRRLFWSAYVADKVQSIYQGRPARLRDADTSVPTLFLDEYEELEPFSSLTYAAIPHQLDSPTRNVSTFEQLCKLSIITESILATLYSEKSASADPVALLQTSNSLRADLEQWRKALPRHLDLQWHDMGNFDVLPHALSLMAMYQALHILNSRPFISDSHLQTLDPSEASSAFTTCVAAATAMDKILQLYEKHFCLKSCPYFISYATYASGTIHARIAAQKPAGSQSHQMLRHCLEVLAVQQEQCHAPRQSMKMLLRLTRKLNVHVGASLTAAKSRTDEDEVGPASAHASADAGRIGDTQTMSTEHEVAGSDTQMESFEIEAIMKSFDPAWHQADYNLNAIDQSSSIGHGYESGQNASNLSSALLGASDLHSGDFMNALDVGYQNINFLDPLFGLDF